MSNENYSRKDKIQNDLNEVAWTWSAATLFIRVAFSGKGTKANLTRFLAITAVVAFLYAVVAISASTSLRSEIDLPYGVEAILASLTALAIASAINIPSGKNTFFGDDPK